MSQTPTTRQPTYDTPSTHDARTGWTGWVLFAGIVMVVVGSFQIIEALTALFRRTYYLVGNDELLLRINYTGWGWIHLIIGVLVVGAGFGVLVGQLWARVVGVILAALSAVANLVFIAAYPVWSLTVIFLDIVVIYAISVHGSEVRD